MKTRKVVLAITLAAGIVFFLSTAFLSYAVDELVLHGVVQNINVAARVVTIDVKSGSCPGVRDFRVDDSSQLNSGMIGKSVTFKIDVSKCESYTIHRILSIKM